MPEESPDRCGRSCPLGELCETSGPRLVRGRGGRLRQRRVCEASGAPQEQGHTRCQHGGSRCIEREMAWDLRASACHPHRALSAQGAFEFTLVTGH